jgi:hypothetical protein
MTNSVIKIFLSKILNIDLQTIALDLNKIKKTSNYSEKKKMGRKTL